MRSFVFFNTWPLFFVVIESILIARQKSCFCVKAQELPAFRTPAFQYNISHRQNVCERQQAWHNRTVLLPDALAGLDLQPWLPLGAFSTLDPDTGAIIKDRPGFFVEVFDQVARRGNFQWRNTFGVTDLRVELGNNSLEELLQWTVQTYDVSVGQWSKNIQRVGAGVSFPEGIYDGSIIMVGIQESESKLDIWSFLQPFEWDVWVMIVVTFLVAGLVYLWMEWFNEDSDRQELGNKPTETVYFSALSFTGDIKFEPSTDYARLFVLSLAFWSLLMSSAYTANLASFLVVENTPLLQVESVEHAVRLGLPMCVLSGTATEFEVTKKHPGANLIHFPAGGGEVQVYQGVLNRVCTLAITTVGSWDEYQRNSQANLGCRLSWVGRVFKFIPSGVATFSDSGTLCTSLIRDVLNFHLLEMEAEGVVRELWEKQIEYTADFDCNVAAENSDTAATDGSNTRLSLQDMGGLFICFYGVTGIAIFMALFSKWNHKRKLTLRRLPEDSGAAVQDTDASQEWQGDGDITAEQAASVKQQVRDMQLQMNEQMDIHRKMNQQMSDILLILNNYRDAESKRS